MKILAFDTCCGLFSVAILHEENIIFSYKSVELNQQSACLALKIKESMEKTGLSYSDLSHLAITIGPGSFTGIRIGISIAQGISLVTGLPIIGITTLEALSYSVVDRSERRIKVAIEAGRKQYYCQEFMDGNSLSNPMLVDEHNMDGSEIMGIPDAQNLAMAARTKLLKGTKMDPIAPLYIREADAVVKRCVNSA